jgi:hypothetical protein
MADLPHMSRTTPVDDVHRDIEWLDDHTDVGVPFFDDRCVGVN